MLLLSVCSRTVVSSRQNLRLCRLGEQTDAELSHACARLICELRAAQSATASCDIVIMRGGEELVRCENLWKHGSFLLYFAGGSKEASDQFPGMLF